VAAAAGLVAAMAAFAAGAADAINVDAVNAGAVNAGAVKAGAVNADVIKISLSNFMFSPMSLTVSVGATVTWTNSDDEPHTVVSNAGLFRSGAMDTNESFSFKFDKPGTYHYTCSIHPRMVGTIVVR
jgi:plastocyanin